MTDGTPEVDDDGTVTFALPIGDPPAWTYLYMASWVEDRLTVSITREGLDGHER